MPTAAPQAEQASRFETQSGLILYWKWVLIGGIAALYAASVYPDVRAGRLKAAEEGRWNLAVVVAAVGLGGFAVRNWLRVKWVRVFDRGGVEWSAGGRVRHREWRQLVAVDTHTKMVMVVGRDQEARPVNHWLTARFDDGASFTVSVREVTEYKTLLPYLRAKMAQAEAGDRAVRTTAVQAEAAQEVADRVTTFGPLGLYRHGVEWDGIYTPWEQIAGFQLSQGILLIRTVTGDEFLKRTAELGDWRTAVERLDAAKGRMAGNRAATAATV